ncbi:hypothetical protein B0H13DRAFT_2334629 [Mycena leptocephala]|nr:hypothetical protein B0H13DRAFT_2334629 [Mycena leptocephala]
MSHEFERDAHVSHPPAEVDSDPRRPHSALLLHCTLEVIPRARVPSLSLLHHRPARASPRIFHWQSPGCRPSVLSALLLPRLQSLALVLLARPCTAPPTNREFGAHPHVHCFYILDTSLYFTLILCPHSRSIEPPPRAPSSHFCLPLFTVHLACTVPTSVLHASRASPPHPDLAIQRFCFCY